MNTIVIPAVLRLVAALIVAAALAACGGGDECPTPQEVAEGKKAIPAEPCGAETY